MKAGFIALILVFVTMPFVYSQQVLIDDKFTDWNGNVASFTDKQGDGNLSRKIDFTDIKISNDQQFLYLYFDITGELNIQENNSISVYIDTDNNSSTGIFKSGIGADMVYNLGPRSGRVYKSTGTKVIFHNEVGLITAPTVTSNRFELRMLREFTSDAGLTTMGPTIKVLFSDEDVAGDKAPDATGGYTYTFDNGRQFSPLPFSIKKSSPDHLRIISYNVLKDNLFITSLQPPFKRIFQALDPDIIGLCEIYNRTSAQTAALIESFLPSTGGRKWYHSEVNPDIRIVSRYPVIDKKALDGNGAFLLDLGSKKLIYIMTHLPCCDNETDRQDEVDNIMSFVRSVRYGISSFQVPQNTPVVIAGDMNLVGLKQQQQTLITGNIQNNTTYGPDFLPDWDDTSLEDVVPVATNNSATFTWYNESGTYSAGRLDYILYTGSVMSVKNSFGLWSRSLTDQQLSSAGLFREDIETASDHLPIVADFQVFGTVASEEPTNTPDIKAYWVGDNLIFSADQSGTVALYDVSGKEHSCFDYKVSQGPIIVEYDASTSGQILILTFRSGTAVKSIKILR